MPAPSASECIVFMPMLAGYERVREVVARAIAGEGLVMRRLEVLLPDAEWQLWLIDSLETAAWAVVDVTDHNPFVMYELGLAHSRRLRSLLVVDSRNERVPATVLGSPFLVYDNADLAAFEPALAQWIAATADTYRPAGQAPDVEADPIGSGHCYELAAELLDRFRRDTSVSAETVSREEFITRLMVADGRGEPCPPPDHRDLFAFHVMPRIIRQADDVAVMRAVGGWIGWTASLDGAPVAAV